MADDLSFPAIIVSFHDGNYVRRPAAGGGKPRAFSDIKESQERILHSCDTIKDDLSKNRGGNQKIGIARLKLRDEALAKSHRPVEAFTQETCPVIGDLDETGELMVLVSPDGLDRLSKKIRSLDQKGATHLTSVESFALVEKERRFPSRVQSAVLDRIKLRGMARLKVRIPSYHIFVSLFREELEEQMLLLTEMGINERPYLLQGDFEVYAVEVRDLEAAMSIASMSFVDRLDLMPTYISSSSQIIDVAGLQLKRQNYPLNLPIVAIVDTGIDPSSPLEPLVYDRVTRVPPSCYNPSHGTSVAALAAASDSLVEEILTPRCRLLDVTVVPNSDEAAGATEELFEDQLTSRLEEIVPAYCSDVKYWNMSLAATPGPRPTAFSDFAIFLDDLQKKFNVQFVCAAGNTKHLRSQWPPYPNDPDEQWVAAPGDTVRGITVGSCTSDEVLNNALAPKGAPSPFSPRGPVAYGVIKPDVVDIGGNIANGGLTFIGVKTMLRDGEISVASGPSLAASRVCLGTSFATPRVCGMSAEINACIERSSTTVANSNILTKALLLHHAIIPDTFVIGPNLRASDYFGFGKPSSLQDTIGDHFWRSTTLIHGRLYPNGQDLVIEDFPYPDGLCSTKNSWGKIWITMVSDPILDPGFKTEYVRSNVDVHFGTLVEGKFRGQTKCVHTETGDEVSLIREEHKWSSIKQYTNLPRMYCRGNLWQLKAKLTLRDKESGVVSKKRSRMDEYAVDFVIALTIADQLHQVEVNNQVFQKWRLRGYVPERIEVAPRLRTQFAVNGPRGI